MIRFAKAADTPQVIALWDLCFPGEEVFRDYFFANLYQPQYNLLLFKGDMLCAMAQMLPYHLQNGTLNEKVTYIYGACTHPEHRRQHLMDKLLHATFTLDMERGISASILIPQEAWLFEFYAQFGYQATFFVSEFEIREPVKAETLIVRQACPTDSREMNMLYQHFAGTQPHMYRPDAEWHKQLDMFQKTGGEVLCTWDENGLRGYAFVWKMPDRVWAQELVCLPEDRGRWASTLQQRYQQNFLQINGFQFEKTHPIGCVRRYHQTPMQNGYMNLMLN